MSNKNDLNIPITETYNYVNTEMYNMIGNIHNINLNKSANIDLGGTLLTADTTTVTYLEPETINYGITKYIYGTDNYIKVDNYNIKRYDINGNVVAEFELSESERITIPTGHTLILGTQYYISRSGQLMQMIFSQYYINNLTSLHITYNIMDLNKNIIKATTTETIRSESRYWYFIDTQYYINYIEENSNSYITITAYYTHAYYESGYRDRRAYTILHEYVFETSTSFSSGQIYVSNPSEYGVGGSVGVYVYNNNLHISSFFDVQMEDTEEGWFSVYCKDYKDLTTKTYFSDEYVDNDTNHSVNRSVIDKYLVLRHYAPKDSSWSAQNDFSIINMETKEIIFREVFNSSAYANNYGLVFYVYGTKDYLWITYDSSDGSKVKKIYDINNETLYDTSVELNTSLNVFTYDGRYYDSNYIYKRNNKIFQNQIYNTTLTGYTGYFFYILPDKEYNSLNNYDIKLKITNNEIEHIIPINKTYFLPSTTLDINQLELIIEEKNGTTNHTIPTINLYYKELDSLWV